MSILEFGKAPDTLEPLFNTSVEYIILIGIENFWELKHPDTPEDEDGYVIGPDFVEDFGARILALIPEAFDCMFDHGSWVKAQFEHFPTPEDISRIIAAINRIAAGMGVQAAQPTPKEVQNV